MNNNHSFHRLIHWFANNAVAANILMIALLVAGFIGLKDIRQEIFPDFTINAVKVSMAYPGASPEEVEYGIVLAIEKELSNIHGIKSVTSKANEGSANLSAELRDDAEPSEVLQDVRSALSRVTSFPNNAEPVKVELRKHGFYVISIGVAAELAAKDLFNLSQGIRNKMLALEGVASVDVRGSLDPQINIEVSQQNLHAYQLSLEQISQKLSKAARNIAAGKINTDDGEILLRTESRRDSANDFADIPIVTQVDGTHIPLARIAELDDGFSDSKQIFEFNGETGVRLDIYQIENQRPIELAQQVRKLASEIQTSLPDSVKINILNDRSLRYAERQKILIKNGAIGLVLVLIALGLFLNPRLAFWVAISIPVVFIGSFSLLPHLDITLNMVSMFAFILAVGIVVDDAIIVGENIHSKRQQGFSAKEAVSQGASEMFVPVLYAVGTNIIAIIPLLLVPGATGQFMRDLPLVAAIVFAISLFEALLVLPAHLRSKGAEGKNTRKHRFSKGKQFHKTISESLDKLRDGKFQGLLTRALNNRYFTLLIFSGFLALIITWFVAGRIDLTWRPEIPGNRVDAEIEMPIDASVLQTLAAVRKVETAGLAAVEILGSRDHIKSWFTRAGGRRSSYGDVNIFLVADDERPFTQEEFTREWRKQLGNLPEAKSIFFEYLVGPGGNKNLKLNLSHPNSTTLEETANILSQQLSELPGVVDISNGIGEGKRQLSFQLTPEARALGLDETSLGLQIRHAFYGIEIKRILRNGKETKVMLRLPYEQRASLSDIRSFIIRTPSGAAIPLGQLAIFNESQAYSTINRENYRRILKVSASIDKLTANSRTLRNTISENLMPNLMARYPGLEWKFSGGRRYQNQAMSTIFNGLIWASLVIFALIAALFASYSQALIVMVTIPFATAGAILGHILLGHGLSSVSIYGMIALAGLAVNGALVLVVKLNQDSDKSIVNATLSRFRPIILTALTTTLGLLPMLFETSTQALFLVPMAIALTFGTITSTLVVLFLIPSLLAIKDDISHWLEDKPKS